MRWVVVGLMIAAAGCSRPAVEAAPAGENTLQSALAAGLVHAEFRGLGGSTGDTIQVTVSKTPQAGPGDLVLAVPPGSVLRSADGPVQNMVVSAVRGRMVDSTHFRPESRIIVSSTAPVVYLLAAYCAEFHKDNPAAGAEFRIEAPDPMLACIAREGQGLPLAALQSAVWLHTDRLSYEEMKARFPIGPSDWRAGQQVVERCRVTLR